MRVLALLALSLSWPLWGQVLTFTASYPYGNLALWQVDVQGASKNIPVQQIWPLAAIHKVGHVDPALVSVLVTKVQNSSGWIVAQRACTVMGAGTAVGAYIKGQANWANDPVATKIAVGATAAAGLCGLLLPTLERQAPSAPPAVSLLTTELVVGSSGCGSGWFWSLQGGDPFVEVLK